MTTLDVKTPEEFTKAVREKTTNIEAKKKAKKDSAKVAE